MFEETANGQTQYCEGCLKRQNKIDELKNSLRLTKEVFETVEFTLSLCCGSDAKGVIESINEVKRNIDKELEQC